MDPFVAIEAQKVLPNRFDLAVAAAARARALFRGATPRVRSETDNAVGIALREISRNALTPTEFAFLLPEIVSNLPAPRHLAEAQDAALSRPSPRAVH